MGFQITIGEIIPGGCVEIDGRAKIGDEILYINDINVQSATQVSVFNFIQQLFYTRKPLVLVLRRNPSPSSNLIAHSSSNSGTIFTAAPVLVQSHGLNGLASDPNLDRKNLVEIILDRNSPEETFGFIVLTSLQKKMVTIGIVFSIITYSIDFRIIYKISP